MPETTIFELEGRNAPLHGEVTFPERSGPRPAVVICHGFKGFMEWGFFPYVAELLAQRGFVAVRFNFRGSGMKPGDELVTDTDAFGHATPGGDLEDLERVLAALGGEVARDRVDRARIGVLGHSRGGGTSILAAASNTAIAALVTWAAVSTFERFDEDAKQAWRESGSLPIVNARTGQTVGIDVTVLDDLEANAARYDVQAAASRRTVPWLIVHGANDETVPIAEASRLRDAGRQRTQLVEIPEGDHTFGAKHPFISPNPLLTEAMNATQSFLLDHLRQETKT